MHALLYLISLLLLCALFTTGCTQSAGSKLDQEPPVAEQTQPAMSREREEPSVDTPRADQVTHEGVLEMARVAGGKRFQPTVLIQDDGSELLLSYRPMTDYYHLVGERVRVTGSSRSPGPHEQHVSGDHFTPDLIVAADGKEREAREDLPPAPSLTGLDQVDAMAGRWVHIQGQFDEYVKTERDQGRVTFKMSAGDEIVIDLYDLTYERDWEALRGKPVTLIGELFRSEQGEAMLSTPTKLCAGHVDTCL